jgi:hypothetical protein
VVFRGGGGARPAYTLVSQNEAHFAGDWFEI